MPVGPFFADFLCREHSLIIELDGFSHDIQPNRDVNRDRYLTEAGYRVLHFQNADVMQNTEGVVMTIRMALPDRPTPNPSRLREGLGVGQAAFTSAGPPCSTNRRSQ